MNVTSKPNGQLKIAPKPNLLELALAVQFRSSHMRFYDTKIRRLSRLVMFLLGLASQIRGVKVQV